MSRSHILLIPTYQSYGSASALSEIQTITLSDLANYVNGAGQSITPIMSGYGPFNPVSLDDGSDLISAADLAIALQTELETEAGFTGKVSVSGAYGNWGEGRFAVSDANSLSIADAAGLRPGDGDFAVACWFVTDDLSATRNPVAKWSGWADWHVQMNANGSIQISVFGDSGGSSAIAVTAAGVIEAGTLYFIYADYQHSTKTIRISVNDRSFATATGGWTTRGSANAALKIGEIGTLGRYWNGLVGPVGYWIGRRLSAGEITSLYNGGVPKGYADLTSGEKASLAGWWGMASPATLTTDESGNGRTLTNNNSVTWGEGSIVLTATFDASLGDLPEMTLGLTGASKASLDIGGFTPNVNISIPFPSDSTTLDFDTDGSGLVSQINSEPTGWTRIGGGVGAAALVYERDTPGAITMPTDDADIASWSATNGRDDITATVETIQDGG